MVASLAQLDSTRLLILRHYCGGMGTWNYVSLAVIGEKKEVNAFNRIALTLPVLCDYVTKRRGKPVSSAMYEDMVFHQPSRWGTSWWWTRYSFSLNASEPVEMVRHASKMFPQLCFRLDWDVEHEEFGTLLARKGRIQGSYRIDADALRDLLFNTMPWGEDDDENDVHLEIDCLLAEAFGNRFDQLWSFRICRILNSQGVKTKTHQKPKARNL